MKGWRQLEKVTMTIRCEPLYEIAIRAKRVEFREIKTHWIKHLSPVKTPFQLRLINGMTSKRPEVTVVVREVIKNLRSGQFELMLGKIIEVKHWSILQERAMAARKTGPK